MRDYVIMTDSCCDLTEKEVKELDLTVASLTFELDGKDYLDTPDHADMPMDEFYRRLAAGSQCTTAAVSVGRFLDTMRPILQAGKDILYIAFSSGLSTTYQSGCIAAEDLKAEFPDRKITVIDSLSASRGQGMLVWRAVQEKNKGKSMEEVEAFVREAIPGQCHWFTVDDLHHLKRGGRVSATTALVGTMLNIKPVMHTDIQGHLTPVGKARGMKAALKALVDGMEKLGVGDLSKQTVFICQAACPDNVAYISGLLRERFGVTDIRSEYIGPVIGSHTGCGTLGLFFVGRER